MVLILLSQTASGNQQAGSRSLKCRVSPPPRNLNPLSNSLETQGSQKIGQLQVVALAATLVEQPCVRAFEGLILFGPFQR